jgi:hypothetical protein
VSSPVTHCPECKGNGYIWTEPHQCTCGQGPGGYYGQHERLCGAEPCPRGCEVIPAERRCPDDGFCGHWCGTRACFRVLCCLPLTVFADSWPQEILDEAARNGGWDDPAPVPGT